MLSQGCTVNWFFFKFRTVQPDKYTRGPKKGSVPYGTWEIPGQKGVLIFMGAHLDFDDKRIHDREESALQ